jgi:exodeoxyribonuclease VII small subunit
MARKAQTNPRNYEEAIKELEGLLAEIEGGEIGLEEVLARYERGVFLLNYCQQTLAAAEKQIELIGRGPDGALTTTPQPENAEPS